MNKNSIVCSGMLITVKEKQLIIPSVRHFDNLIHRLIPVVKVYFKQKYPELSIDDIKHAISIAEQGFIDRHGKFHTREEAWKIATPAGQIKRHVGGDSQNGGTLYSENLY